MARLSQKQMLYLTTEENTLGVEVKGKVPVLLCGILCRTVFVDASIVDSNVEASQLSNNSFDHPAYTENTLTVHPGVQIDTSNTKQVCAVIAVRMQVLIKHTLQLEH